MKCNGRTCKNEAEPGMKACTRCREYRRGYYSVKRAEPKDPTLCKNTDCPNKADPGYKSCQRCRDRTKAREDQIRPELREKAKSFYRRLKDEVFAAYGGCANNGYICACCGVTHKEFLSIDHIDGDGPAHREKLTGDPRNGQTLYYWLKRNNFPPGFRVLCMNCNFALGHHGFCPHNKGLTQTCKVGRASKDSPLPTAVV